MYLESILHYLLWPLLILISWFVVNWALKRFEKNRRSGK